MITNATNPSVSRWPALARKVPLTQQPCAPHFQGGPYGPAAAPVDLNTYQTPRPAPWLISMLTPVNEYLALKGIPLLRNVPLLNRIPGIQGLANIERIDLPQADLERLKKALNSKTVAFVGPNHPEFFTDWAIDKKITSLVAPEMASWADARVVNSSPLAKRFCLACNAIANNGKAQGKADSIQSALDGKGVLLHPEGRVWWDGDNIHTLYPGIAEMPIEAARQSQGSNQPVYIVPVVWKFHYPTDVSPGLHRDMEDLEKKLGLPPAPKHAVGARFFKLQTALLEHQEKQFGLPAGQQAQQQLLPYFKRQAKFRDFLIQNLEIKYGKQHALNTEAHLLALEKAVNKARQSHPSIDRQQDLAILTELYRIEGFSPARYNRPELTQEHLYENIKRAMQSFFEGAKIMIPQPAGRRVVHIRVAEPINVRERVGPNLSPEEEQHLTTALLKQLKQSLQQKLDEVNAEIEPSVKQFRVKNEFYSPQPLEIQSKL
jgi:hypothetical protein